MPCPDVVLVLGLPRSGTSWVARVLGRTEGARYLHEPDNDSVHPFAIRSKLHLGIHPALDPEDRAPELKRLWEGAFAGGRNSGTIRDRAARRLHRTLGADERRGPIARMGAGQSLRLRATTALAVPLAPRCGGRLVVKSVASNLCIEWLVARWEPRVVVVTRNPLNVVSSWLELEMMRGFIDVTTNPMVRERYVERWGLRLPEPDAPLLVRASWQAGLLRSATTVSIRAHPDWTVVSHDDLCVAPETGLRALAERVGWDWTGATSAYLREHDRPGVRFKTDRIAAEQPERWRTRLSVDDAKVVRGVLSQFEGFGGPWEAAVA